MATGTFEGAPRALTLQECPAYRRRLSRQQADHRRRATTFAGERAETHLPELSWQVALPSCSPDGQGRVMLAWVWTGPALALDRTAVLL